MSKANENTVVESRGPGRGKTSLPVSAKTQATAKSANSRINIPLNLENFRHLAAETAEELTWFHQHILEANLGWGDVIQLLQKPSGGTYDRTVIFRVLSGSYEGSWDNIVTAIRSYRDTYRERLTIRRANFAPNAISAAIWAGLDYAFAAQGITEICGESGAGKTISALQWRDAHNHGRTVYIEAPVVGGLKALMREIAGCVGVNRNLSTVAMQDSLRRAFNANRMLIVDEASRLLPNDTRSNPSTVEFLRWLHDQTGCALALITTARFGDTIRRSSYLFEQLLGRIDMPVRLPRELDDSAWLPIVAQFVPEPSVELSELCSQLANGTEGGRLRRLAKLLAFASRVAATDQEPFGEIHIFRAYAMQTQMKGETLFARK